MAEEEGFEPPRSLSTLTVFKTGAFNHSAIPPLSILAENLVKPRLKAARRSWQEM